jgi:hypothetical protein
MFSQTNLSDEIGRAIPALHIPLHTPECERSIYKQLDVLSHYVADAVCDNNVKSTRQALKLIDHLYAEGNGAIRSAIENVFVFSLSGTLSRLGQHRERLLRLIPVTLFTVYMHQVLHKGC